MNLNFKFEVEIRFSIVFVGLAVNVVLRNEPIYSLC